MSHLFQDEWVMADGDTDQTTVSENESGWETGEADDSTSAEEEEEEEEDDDGDGGSSSYSSSSSSSSSWNDADQRQNLLHGNESGVMGGVAEFANQLGDPDDASLAAFPENFGWGGEAGISRRAYHDDEYHDNDEERQGVLEAFQDEPDDQVAAYGGLLEPVPEDEYEDSSHQRLSRSSSIRTIQTVTSHMTRRLGLSLMLCSLLLLLIAAAVGLTMFLTNKDDDNTTQTKAQALTPTPTLSPARVPTPVISVPSLSLPPFEPSTVVVPVSIDGYVNLGGIILRDTEVTHSTTLLVRDGYHHTASLSIIEFNTSSTLANSFMMEGWVTSAVVTLNVASADLEGLETTTLYARVYPNDKQPEPDVDINQYGYGGVDFDEKEWIPFRVSTPGGFQSRTVDIDITDFFLEQYLPTQDGGVWENIKILIAHDNSDGRENKGATVQFYSSEAADLLRPRLKLQLDPPDANSTPAPSTSHSPSTGPTVSLAPSTSASPSRMPSVAPSLKPTSSWSPTYSPTVSPAPTITSYPICSVCGALALVNPKAKVNIRFRGFDRGSDPDDRPTCGGLQELGLTGEIPPKECQRYQSQVADTCCEEPDGAGLYTCDLCLDFNLEEGGVSNPDATVTIPFLGETRTCQQYQNQADAGQIPESICGVLQPYTTLVCCGLVI